MVHFLPLHREKVAIFCFHGQRLRACWTAM